MEGNHPSRILPPSFAALAAVILVAQELQNAADTVSRGIRSVYEDAARGEQYTKELLLPRNWKRLHRYCRFRPEQFHALHEILCLVDGKIVSSEQQLLLFLRIVATGCSWRDMQEDFHHSGDTITHWFHIVLDKLVQQHSQLVIQANRKDSHRIRRRLDHSKYWPFFEGAVGAIDGSHIAVSVSNNEAAPYRNRKGFLSQNVLAAVNYDMRFTYVLAGWEGSAHDARVLSSAKAASGSSCFKQPLRKGYYLADAGYSNTRMTMVPYRGVRYHLQEQYQAPHRPENAHELFNLRHSSLRNVIERAFGLFKQRFKIFNTAPQFPTLLTQVKLVYACTGLHNFLIDTRESDSELARYGQLTRDADNHYNGSRAGMVIDAVEAKKARGKDGGMTEHREKIAQEMWQQYQEYLRAHGQA